MQVLLTAMITNFKVSSKTKHPKCCHWACCGSKFGRIERSQYASRAHGQYNRIVRARRYAKHVERQLVRREIAAQLQEEFDDVMDFIEDLDDEFLDYLLHSSPDNNDDLVWDYY